MRFKFDSIKAKIRLGFGLILLIVFILSIAIVIGIRNINEVNEQLTTNFVDTEKQLITLNSTLKESVTLTKNWIYQPVSGEKEKLTNFLLNDSKNLLYKLDSSKSVLTEDHNEQLIDEVKASINECIVLEIKVTEILKTTEDYNSDSLIDSSILILKDLDDKYAKYNAKLELLNNFIESKSNNLAQIKGAKVTALVNGLYWILGIAILVCVIIGILIMRLLEQTVSRPMNTILDSLKDIESGEIIQLNEIDSNDEVAKINNSLVKVIDSLTKKSDFANEIGKGNLDIDFTPLSEKDVLGNSLLAMRLNLRNSADDEQKRNWAVHGLAEIGTLLRNQTNSAEELYIDIVRFVVKYTKSNQGGLFLLSDEDENDKHLKLVACYAYDRRKYLNKTIRIGEGLIGQCVLEKASIYLKEVPKDYVSITSGLGSSTPKELLIIPLKVNEEVHGVMEIASFHAFENYQIEFLEKLMETIASAISSVRINARTKELLQSTQQQAEEMKSQEEEMRQNMEELSATQEEMSRKNTDMQSLVAESSSIINGINTVMATIEFTPDGVILGANGNWLKTVKYLLYDIKGKHHRIFVDKDIADSEEYKQFWKNLAAGIPQSGTFKRKNANNEVIWLNAVYNPIMNENGEVVKIMKFATDITHLQNLLAENKSIVDGINYTMATIEFTPDGTITNANENWLKTVKYSLEDIQGKHHRIFIGKEMNESEEYKTFWKSLASGKANSGLYKRFDAQSNEILLNAVYNPIFNENGEVVKIIKFATVVNINTDLKTLEPMF